MRAATEKWVADSHDLGGFSEPELIKRGVVRDLLGTEYEARRKRHPATPPVPGMD
jgi:hypothetical protein